MTLVHGENGIRPEWPRELLPNGEVEFKREPKRYPRELTSYIVATTYGLLLGRAFSLPSHRRKPRWFAEGWTPITEEWTLGPFETRWEAFEALRDIESKGSDRLERLRRNGMAMKDRSRC